MYFVRVSFVRMDLFIIIQIPESINKARLVRIMIDRFKES